MILVAEATRNIDLGKNQITPKIRVSTAAIFRNDLPWDYWLVETWFFSEDKRQKSHQIIHGTPYAFPNETTPNLSIIRKAKNVHAQITNNLRKRHGGWRGVFYRDMWQ